MSTAASDSPLAALGLSAASVRTLTDALQALQQADEKPDDAIEALMYIESLEPGSGGDSARIFLMGADILDTLADLICICDEPAISGNAEEQEEEEEEAALSVDMQVELASRACNALGSLATFPPFRLAVLEEDYSDEPLDDDVVETIATVINRREGGGAGEAEPFRMHRFGVGARITHYPLLCALLFWSRADARWGAGVRAHALFALSWLLAEAPLAAMCAEAGTADILFRTLAEMLPPEDSPVPAATLVAGAATGGRSRAGSVSSASSERVSSTQENLRLYAAICLQRLARTPALPLFSEEPALMQRRLHIVLRLLQTVPSFNIRAILLNVLFAAVSPAASSATAASSPSAATAMRMHTDLPLPLSDETVRTLQLFREDCGSIGSSAPSRRESPALHALAAPARQPPPLSASFSSSSSSGALQQLPPVAPSAPSATHLLSPTASHSADAVDEDATESAAGARSDKTGQLQALVDAILERHNQASLQHST